MAKIKLRQQQPPGTGDPQFVRSTPNKTVLDTYADTRDILSTLVGGGHTSLSNIDLQNNHRRLSDLVGPEMAQKLANQAFLFNQRPDVQRLPMEERVKNFFSLGSNDAQVAQFLKNAGAIGQGQVQAFNTSPLFTNSVLQSKDFTQGAPPVENKKVKLIVKK